MVGKTFRLPQELIDRIEARAKRERRTASQLVRIQLERANGVKRKANKRAA